MGDVNQSYFTRIDIAGKAPFNTLVFCNYGIGGTSDTDKDFKRGKLRAISPYKLAGFDQLNPPPVFQHTTTGWIYNTSLGDTDKNKSGPDAWLWAIDDIIDGGFDDNGNFYVDFDCATMMPDQEQNPNYEPGGFVFFSYILVQEPQPKRDPKHPPRVPMAPHNGPKGPGQTEM